MPSEASTCDAAISTSREQARRLHFCDDVATPAKETSSPGSFAPYVRSAIKSPTRRASSARRLTGTGETLHVHVNPCPNVVEAGEEDNEAVNTHEKDSNGQVANELAMIGAQGNGYHNLLYGLADLLLRRRPKSPEQCIVDHLYSRQLPTTLAVPNGRVFETATGPTRAAPEAETMRLPAMATTACDTAFSTDTMAGATEVAAASAATGAPDTAASRRHTEQPPAADETPNASKVSAHASLSDPTCGGSVAERLTCGLAGCPAGRSVALRYAKLLLHRKPDDPEDFLWTRLEGRSFGDDAAATNALSSTADAMPNFSADDPTQAALLKEMPLNTPGYNVAAGVVALLFTRKPDNVVSFLFYHYSGRVHSSAAASARSSSRRRGAQVSSGSEADPKWHTSGDVSDDSRTSRELVEEDEASDDAGVATENETAMVVTGAEGLGGRTRAGGRQDTIGPDERRGRGTTGGKSDSDDDTNDGRTKGSEGSDDSSTSGNSASGSGSSSSGALVSYVATSLPRGGSFGSFGDSLQFSRRHTRQHRAHGKTQRAALPAARHAATVRTLHSVPAHAGRDADSGRAAGLRHVTITDAAAATTPRATTPLYEPAAAATLTTALHSTLAQQDSLRSLALIRHEYELLRLREEHRRWRLQHEVETLRQECAFREHLTRYDHSEQALSTAHAAAEMLQEAEHYLRFLETQAERLQVDMQRAFGTTTATASSSQLPFGPSTPASSLLPSYDETGVPSELDILKKRVELLSMEQERARALAQQQRVTTPHARRGSNVSGRRAGAN